MNALTNATDDLTIISTLISVYSEDLKSLNILNNFNRNMMILQNIENQNQSHKNYESTANERLTQWEDYYN